MHSHIVIDLDADIDRSGYGDTAGVRILYEEGINIQKRAGLRVAAFSADGFGVLWSPIAERIDEIKEVTVNGIWMEGDELEELRLWMERMVGIEPQRPENTSTKEHENESRQNSLFDDIDLFTNEPSDNSVESQLVPDEPKVKVDPVNESDINKVEKHLDEHPIRDFKSERWTEVYTGYVGFIEIHLTGARLSEKMTLTVPNEFKGIGLEDNLKKRLRETLQLDITDKVDLGAKDVNRRVDAFREIFTKNVGKPMGRIYKKSEWSVMKSKWDEIEKLVQTANTKIPSSLDDAVNDAINTIATDYAKVPKLENSGWTVDKIENTLKKQLHQQKPAQMKLELVRKDLTWDMLNDGKVQQKIIEIYPELEGTGLFQSRKAYAIP